jgi:two-component system sensor histidine kinase PilS (NtrC family)
LLFAQPPQINRIPWELSKLIEETIDLFIHSPSFRDGIHILPVHCHETVKAMIDPGQMKQVFWNLLLNAAQAMPNGGEISIRVEKGKDTLWQSSIARPIQGKGKEWVKVTITDSGTGIPPHEKEKIFEPFFTTKDGGTGLGLSIVHKIIESHNGVIKVESEVGKGSTFIIFFPTE